MILLALESSADSSSVAIWQDAKILAHQFVEAKYGHAERIVMQAEAVLSQAKIKISDIDYFIGGRGPGSFTGIRTCLAAVIGFSIVADTPCFGINGLSALGFACSASLKNTDIQNEKLVVLAISDTRRGSFYCQEFKAENLIPSDIEDLTLPKLYEKIKALAKSGFLVRICGALSEDTLKFDDTLEKPELVHYYRYSLAATDIAHYAAWQIENGRELSPATPLYLAPPNINQPKKPLS